MYYIAKHSWAVTTLRKEMDEQRRRSLKRSLSEGADKRTISCPIEVKKKFFEDLKECWEQELFCDVNLIAQDKSVHQAHRLVLSCISPYFRALFSPRYDSQTNIELRDINAETIKLVLRYGYGAEVGVTGENVQELIVAANYLQLSSLESQCSLFISEHIDVSNIIEVKTFAECNGLLDLEKACNFFINENFGEILFSPTLLALDVLQVQKIIQNDSIRVFDSSAVVPPPSIQEKLLFKGLLRYAEEVSHRLPLEEILPMLFPHVRFHLLMKYEIEAVREMVARCRHKELRSYCTEQLLKSVTENPGTLKHFEDNNMPLYRNFEYMKPARTQPMAHGYVGNIKSSFVDRVEGVPRYVKGMKIWIRRWDGRPVFGAIEVRYSDGENAFHGQISNHKVYEFMLDEDEFITKVISFSGYMIDQLEFITNKGKSYGPYGGDGGGQRIHTITGGNGYLSFVSGAEAMTQGSLGIVSFSFHWMLYDFKGMLREREGGLTPSVTLDDYDAYDMSSE